MLGLEMGTVTCRGELHRHPPPAGRQKLSRTEPVLPPVSSLSLGAGMALQRAVASAALSCRKLPSLRR